MLLESYYSDIFKSKKKRKVKKIIGSTNTRLRKNPSRHNADSNEFKDFLEMSINHSNSEGYISFKSF